MSHLSSPQADNSQLSCDIHTGTLFAPPTKYKNVYNSIETLQMLPTLTSKYSIIQRTKQYETMKVSFFFFCLQEYFNEHIRMAEGNGRKDIFYSTNHYAEI